MTDQFQIKCQQLWDAVIPIGMELCAMQILKILDGQDTREEVLGEDHFMKQVRKRVLNLKKIAELARTETPRQHLERTRKQ